MFLTKRRSALTIAASTALVMGLSACGASGSQSSDGQGETITVVDNNGEQTVPKNPSKYAVTDNLSFHTLEDWDKKPVAAARSLMPESSKWKKDDSIVDTGRHNEPDLEKLVGAQPSLVINGYRYAQHQDKIKELLPNTPVVTFDRKDDESHIDNLKRHTEKLGEIFDEKDSAQKKVSDLDSAIDDAKKSYDGSSTAIGLTTTGGKINYSDPNKGRGAAPLFEAVNYKHALDVDGSDSKDTGNDVSVETIAKSNPDWMIVLDRDGALVKSGRVKDYTPAEKLIYDSAALKNTTAVKKKQVIILPADLYLDEGIEMYTDIFNQAAKAMQK